MRFTPLLWLTLASFPAVAQVDCFQKSIHASSIRASVADISGEPIANAEIVLTREEKIVKQLTTDENGKFTLTPIAGNYRVAAKAPGFAPASTPITIRRGAISLNRPERLWFILLPGVDQNGDAPCPPVVTSEGKFQHIIIKQKTKYNHGSEEKNATQK